MASHLIMVEEKGKKAYAPIYKSLLSNKITDNQNCN